MKVDIYNSWQKFYSSLSHLERFSKDNDFFSNVSNLDSFFSEFRNVTFVLQKSLSNSPYIELYKNYRDMYLTDRWFVLKRNEITKEAPFPLKGELDIFIFSSEANTDTKHAVFELYDTKKLMKN
ncbi:MAG: hypothetical protein RR700_06375 [Anaerorhabdus sp.]|uniref:hypothetical protein n=1 Tax=Anaerorhabdus sp. TaxID=1872524 RepID=UPI002FC8C460